MSNKSGSSKYNTSSSQEKVYPDQLLVMYRQRSRLTQKQVADQLGLKSDRMLRVWEGGFGLPKAERLRQLIELYLTLGVFTPGEVENEVAELWQAIKARFDATTERYETYPIFDKGWFTTLSRHHDLPPQPLAANSTSTTSVSRPDLVIALPLPANPFIGRIKALDDLLDLLKPDHSPDSRRLLTLVGAGGIGKTRLALEVARQAASRFSDGVWLVELASLEAPNLVASTIARSLKISFETGYISANPALVALKSYLQSKELLIVLDNCEHLVEECALITQQLLESCPGLFVLATSREILAIPAEQIWRVPSLACPPPAPAIAPSADPSQHQSEWENLEGLAEYEAVQLFVERARATQPDFVLTQANSGSVTQICQRLDGIPLALELAAARVAVLPLSQLASYLEDAFGLLTSGSRTALPRHQTLRQTLDWSYNLLSKEEQKLFQTLAVFEGGWSVEADRQVCGQPEISLEPGQITGLLWQLVNKSLVVSTLVEEDRVARYRMLEPVKQYAHEKLGEVGHLVEFKQHHLNYFLELAETAAPQLSGSEQAQWLERVESEEANFRAALGFGLGQPGSESRIKALRLAVALGEFWYVRGRYSEGRQWLEQGLAQAQDASPSLQAQALRWVGFLAIFPGDYTRANQLLNQALEQWRKLGIKGGLALTLANLGFAANNQGQLEAAQAYYDEALAIHRETNNRVGQVFLLRNLGILALHQQKMEQAVSLLEEAWAINEVVRDKRMGGHILNMLSVAALQQGEVGRGYELSRQSLQLMVEVGDHFSIAGSLNRFGWFAIRRQGWERAVKLVSASEQLLKAIGGISLPGISFNKCSLAEARGPLDEASFHKAWEEGQRMTEGEAVAYALLEWQSD